MASSMDEAGGGEIRREGSLEPIQNHGSPNKRKERPGRGSEDRFGGGDKRARILHGIEINEPRDNKDDYDGKTKESSVEVGENKANEGKNIWVGLGGTPDYMKKYEALSCASINRSFTNLMHCNKAFKRQTELFKEMMKETSPLKKTEGLLLNPLEVKNALPMPNGLAEKMQNDIFKKVEKMQNDLVEKAEKMQNDLVEKVEKMQNELVERVEKRMNELVEKVEKNQNDLVEKIRNDLVEKIRNDLVEKIRNDLVEKIRNDLVEKIRNDQVEQIRNDQVEKVDAE